MALARRCNSMDLRSPVGLRCVKYTRSFGRKRVLISSFEDLGFSVDDSVVSAKRRICSVESDEKSAIESLPQDVLIRILCGVDHSDLKQLSEVSTVIREAAAVAEKMHFAYSTPKKTAAFRSSLDFSADSGDIETPNAPIQQRNYRPRLNGKKLAGLSVQLFA